MGKMAELWEKQSIEADQEDPKLYDEWKKESFKLLKAKTNPTIIERIKQYFIRKGIK